VFSVLGGWDRTHAKLYSSLSLQSKCKKPSFITYFAVKIFALLFASANGLIIRESKWGGLFLSHLDCGFFHQRGGHSILQAQSEGQFE
jgi:hypothetical protein